MLKVGKIKKEEINQNIIKKKNNKQELNQTIMETNNKRPIKK